MHSPYVGETEPKEKKGSHVAELNGLCDRRQAHGADGVWALANVAGTIETEEVMATGNQGRHHLLIHALEADLRAPHRRARARPVGQEGLGRRGRGGGAFPGGREGGAVRREPVGVQVPRGARRSSGDAPGLRVLQGFGPRDDRREARGPGLTALQMGDKSPRE